MKNPVNRLDSWKEIAAYLGKDVRTAARWAAKRGLPIHRVPGGGRQSVFAYKEEIDAWLNGSFPPISEDEAARSAAMQAPADENHSSDDVDSSVWLLPPEQSGSLPATKVAGGRLFVACFLLAAFVVGIVFVWRLYERVPQPEVIGVVQLTDDGLPKRAIATDGRNVYFNEVSEGRYVTASVPVGGGPVRRIATPSGNSYLLDVSSDGKWLLVAAWELPFEEGGPLWLVSTSGAPARRASSVLCHAATFSPDASVIVYATGVELWAVDSRTFAFRRIATLPGPAYHLKWSPDGKRIMFSVEGPGSADLFPWEIEVTRRATFAAARELTKLRPSPCCVNWSWTHDLRYLFFSSPRLINGDFEYDNRIWIKRNYPPYSSSGQELLTGLKLNHSFQLAGENNQLFLLGGSDWHYQLVRYRQIHDQAEPYLAHVSALYLNFSRDGQWVTYVRAPDNTLWRSRVDGSDPLQLTQPPMFTILPQWSPDGDAIAFSTGLPGKPYRIYIVSRDGGIPKEVSKSSDNQGAPTWSPDAKSLFYANFLCAQEHSCAVHMIDLETGLVTTLPDSQGLRTARVSPDGKYLAALEPSRSELRVYDFQNQEWKILASNFVGDNLSWSHDSQSLFFDKAWGSDPAIIRVTRADGRQTVAVHLDRLPASTGWYMRWFGLDPQDIPIIATAINYFEIYRVEWRMH